MLYLLAFVVIVGYFTNKQNNRHTVYTKLEYAQWEAYCALSHMKRYHERYGDCTKASLDYWQERYDSLRR